jgi:hypothetical protein
VSCAVRLVPVWGNRWERERRNTGTSYLILVILSSFRI